MKNYTNAKLSVTKVFWNHTKTTCKPDLEDTLRYKSNLDLNLYKLDQFLSFQISLSWDISPIKNIPNSTPFYITKRLNHFGPCSMNIIHTETLIFKRWNAMYFGMPLFLLSDVASTLPMHRLLLSKAQECKYYWKSLSCWYSLEGSGWVASDEYPCARVQQFFQDFCIIL